MTTPTVQSVRIALHPGFFPEDSGIEAAPSVERAGRARRASLKRHSPSAAWFIEPESDSRLPIARPKSVSPNSLLRGPKTTPMAAQSPESLSFADLTPLLDENGHAVDWLDEHTARARIRSGELTVCRWTKKKIRALRTRTAPALAASPPKPELSKWNLFSHPTRPGDAFKDSSEANPYGVWSIEPIRKGERRFFGLRAAVVHRQAPSVDDGRSGKRAA